MEIIIGYSLGFVVLILFVVTLFKAWISRIDSSRREISERVTKLEKRVGDIKEKN